MSHDEKVAYRVENDIPNTVDKWIEEEKIHTEKPTAKPYDRNAPSAYASLQDNVECILNVTREVVSVPNCRVLQCVIDFQPQLGLDGLEIRTSIIFTLTLQVCIPPTTGFLMHYWHSPAVIIDQYTEDNLDNLSPNWLETVRTNRRFWQNRILMLEMMLYFVRNIPQNSRLLRQVTAWCNAMSVSFIH